MKNNNVWLEGIIAGIIVMAVVGWFALKRFGWVLLLFILAILLLTRCSLPVVKNVKYTTPRSSITGFPVVYTAHISLGDAAYYQGELVVYDDPKTVAPRDYVIIWWLYPRELHSIIYRKGKEWYWKILDGEPKEILHLEVGGVEIF